MGSPDVLVDFRFEEVGVAADSWSEDYSRLYAGIEYWFRITIEARDNVRYGHRDRGLYFDGRGAHLVAKAQSQWHEYLGVTVTPYLYLGSRFCLSIWALIPENVSQHGSLFGITNNDGVGALGWYVVADGEAALASLVYRDDQYKVHRELSNELALGVW